MIDPRNKAHHSLGYQGFICLTRSIYIHFFVVITDIAIFFYLKCLMFFIIIVTNFVISIIQISITLRKFQLNPFSIKGVA